MKNFFNRRMGQQDNGTAAIEFAILLPVMVLMLVGLFEVSNFIFCNNKMNRTAQEISNIATRGDTTKPQMDSLLQAAVYVAQPFNFTQSGNVIVTSVSHQNPDPTKPSQVMWQDSYPGGVGASRINPASLPGGLVLEVNQTVIFTEVFFKYTPSFPSYGLIATANTNVYALAAAFPRQGTMTTLPPS